MPAACRSIRAETSAMLVLRTPESRPRRRMFMKKNAAGMITEVLHVAGVRRIYGVVGDSLNGITESLRTRGDIEWIHVRHEEVAAFAAGAEAQLTGELAVCAGSCGPGKAVIGGRAGEVLDLAVTNLWR